MRILFSNQLLAHSDSGHTHVMGYKLSKIRLTHILALLTFVTTITRLVCSMSHDFYMQV